MKGTSGQFEKDKILSDKVEMQNNGVENNKTRVSTSVASYVVIVATNGAITSCGKASEASTEKEWHEGISHLRLLDVVQNAGDNFIISDDFVKIRTAQLLLQLAGA